MKIALTTPNFWPYVRRGTARYIWTLTGYLIEKGHSVTIVTAKPGRRKAIVRQGYVIKYFPYYQHPVLMRYVNRIQVFSLFAFWSFYRDKYDVVYCMHFPDGFAAHLIGKFKEIRYMLNITSVPLDKYWGNSRINRYMFEKGVESAHGIMFPSNFAEDHMRERYHVHGKVIPMPVETHVFNKNCEKDIDSPKILFVSDLTDRRKGLSVLLQAFYQFKKKIPKSVLLLAGQTDKETNRRLIGKIPPDMRSSVKILGQGRLKDLPFIYAGATMTVLPAMYEVFGMVLLESLSSGTPVVGCNSGAIPEIITSSEIGRLFEPLAREDVATNAVGLYEAMMDVYEIAKNRETPAKCRSHAMKYDISVIGARIERYLKKISTLGS